MIPVLLNLITSTDEVNIFAMSQKVNKAEKLHVTAKPTTVKNPSVNSGSQNYYTTHSHGDSHCQGGSIVLNRICTAGGLTVPVFVVVYALGTDDMPHNDIVTVPIDGLTVAGDQNLYSVGNGWQTFKL